MFVSETAAGPSDGGFFCVRPGDFCYNRRRFRTSHARMLKPFCSDSSRRGSAVPSAEHGNAGPPRS
ncbi:hypothetical protein AW736_12820 [Termitidicoccus mucosus]|uniref:Uncharacterized protein n=1 Tax=Termitidicoccus mucosus TaxID=1184151 RepID=A0A178IHV2_9BACT|nr:hypothetical protein AW736_12820 [Opitutaceae bacterium TSB47]